MNLVLLPLVDAIPRNFLQPALLRRGLDDRSGLSGGGFPESQDPALLLPVCCPLGALFGVLGRFALWRIGKTKPECTQCKLCEANCEGGCEPAGQIRIHECVLCMNCLDECRHDLIAFRTAPSATGEIVSPGSVAARLHDHASYRASPPFPLLRLERLSWRATGIRG